MPFPLRDLAPLLPGVALWALAFYLPLTAALTPLERSLAAGPLDANAQQLLLVVSGLALALVVGLISEVAFSWALGPSWATSLGLMAVLAGLFWGLADRGDEDPPA
jgi:hypothetical protein